METVALIFMAILAIIVLSLILGSFFTVNTAEMAVVTRFGKFLQGGRARTELENAVSWTR